MKILKPSVTTLSDPAITDEELFIKMSNVSNFKLAQEAFNEFFRRYYNYLWKVCFYVCKNQRQSEDVAKEVFLSTFSKAFKKAHTYKGNVGIKAWLGKIAKNELIDYFRKNNDNNKTILIPDGYDPPENDQDDSDEIIHPSSLRGKLDIILDNLSDRDKDIILTYMRYYDDQNPNRHLPDDEMSKLCLLYNTNADNIRKIKQRTLKKIKHLLI